MSARKHKKIFQGFLLGGWLLTLGFHITSSWNIYQVVGQNPNNWRPPGKPHISYLISENEKSFGVPFLLTYQFDQSLADFRFHVETDDAGIREVVIKSLDVTYGNSAEVERICENQACGFEKVVTPEWLGWSPNQENFKFSFVAPESIKLSREMKVVIKYYFKRENGELEEFVIENEREYRKSMKVRSYWMAILEGVGTGGV